MCPDIKEVELSVDLSFLMMKRYGNGLAKALMGFGEPGKGYRGGGKRLNYPFNIRGARRFHRAPPLSYSARPEASPDIRP